MIIDKLENVSFYKNIPADVVDFIKNLHSGINNGRYELSGQNYVNIESYSTKPLADGKFESHKNYIDIQLLLKGTEKIYVTGINNLEVFSPYNPERDITFYGDKIDEYPYITLDSTNFVMFMPHEAHAPQISNDEKSETVQKVVVKIKID